MELTLLTLADVGELLGVHKSTVRDYVYSGELQCVKVSPRKYLFTPKQIASFLDLRSVTGRPEQQNNMLEMRLNKLKGK
jgi:excisionase family DNA binding protein